VCCMRGRCACVWLVAVDMQGAGLLAAARSAEMQRCSNDARAAPAFPGACCGPGGRQPPAACTQDGRGRAPVGAAALLFCGVRRFVRARILHQRLPALQASTCTRLGCTQQPTHCRGWGLVCDRSMRRTGKRPVGVLLCSHSSGNASSDEVP